MIFPFSKKKYYYLFIPLLTFVEIITIHSSEPISFHNLVEEGVDRVKNALTNGKVSINQQNSSHETLLDIAADKGNVAIVEYLLSVIKRESMSHQENLVNHALKKVTEGLDKPQIRVRRREKRVGNDDGPSLESRKILVIQLLVDKGNANIQQKDSSGHSPFTKICGSSMPELVHYFIKKVSDDDQFKKGLEEAIRCHRDSKTAIILFNNSDISCSQEQANSLLTSLSDANLRFKNNYDKTEELFNTPAIAVHFTNENKTYEEFLEKLLNQFLKMMKSDECFKKNEKKEFDEAAKLLKSLIDKGKVNVTSKKAEDIFFKAYILCLLDNKNKNHYQELVHSFLQIEDFKQDRVLNMVILACYLGNIDEIALLMDHVDPTKRKIILDTHFENGMNALLAACIGQKLEVVKKLVGEYHLDVNATKKGSKRTALMEVAARRKRKKEEKSYVSVTWDLTEEKDLKIVKYLLANGASTGMLDKLGKTVYTLAQETQKETGNNQKIVDYLEEYKRTSGSESQNGGGILEEKQNGKATGQESSTSHTQAEGGHVRESQNGGAIQEAMIDNIEREASSLNGSQTQNDHGKAPKDRKQMIEIIVALFIIIVAIGGIGYGYIKNAKGKKK